MDDRLERFNRIEILLKEYATLREEGLALAAHYKSHVRNVQLFGGALVGVSAYATQGGHLRPTEADWLIWAFGAVMVTLLGNYLIFDILSPQYWMSCGAARVATIEDEINRLAGERLLMWESAAAARFGKGGFFALPGVLNPEFILGLLAVAMYSLSVLLVPLAIAWALWGLGPSCALRLVSVAVGTLAVVMTTVCFYSGRGVLLKARHAAEEEIVRLRGHVA